ncbi:unnamed protein product, partial [Mesorhabditis spiculigera]
MLLRNLSVKKGLCNVSSILLPIEEAKKKGIYALKWNSSRLSWKNWVTLGAGLLAVCLVVYFLFFNGPSYYYNRDFDAQLAKFIHVSPAARKLPKSGSLFCWAMTSTKYHGDRVPAVNGTWLPRCDHGQFFTNDAMDPELNIAYSTVFAGIPDTYENLFFKTRYALRHIYRNISSQFNWYLKADDDTYVIVENLRAYLAKLDPNIPYYLGYRLRPYLEHGYNGGGAGYVLSRAAMELFSEKLYDNATLCPDDIYEDLGVGRCFANVQIYPLDTRNNRGQQRFNTFRPDQVFKGSVVKAPYWIYDVEIKGFDAVGEDLVSFHHITPDEMRLFEMLLYRVRKPSTPQNPTPDTLISKADSKNHNR